MLGPLEVRTDDGATVVIPGSRLRVLLVALALDPDRAVPRARLIDQIWGENPPSDSANALQALVSRLRKILPEGSVDARPGGYRLRVDPDAVDAGRFERLVAEARDADDDRRARDLRTALNLWRGTPLQDVDLPDNTALSAAVTRLDELRLTALEERAEADVRLGRGPEVIAELTELVVAHPLRERFVGALMRALSTAGRGAEALSTYQDARARFVEALGVEPSAELSELHGALLHGEPSAGPTRRGTNLRAELTSFIGKEDDLDAVADLVRRNRLTTLTGPGGSGKTRLAAETARALLAELPGGAWLVELASVTIGEDVAKAVLAALDLRDHGLLGTATTTDPTERLVAALRDQEALLILDNCEHVIATAAAFAHRMLGECRGLRILATSREALGITGETLWQVEPLALPTGDADRPEIEASPAVRLLLDRAGAVRKDLVADEHTVPVMARICRALDGIPLAIELAAARLRSLALDQLANRLDDRFRLLTGGSRTALPRHRTLRAVVDWSWELLTDAERGVLRRLSVFSGGASLEAAEQVCAGGEVHPDDVLDLLTALTEKSLLLTDGTSTPRYRMLDTIAEYAAHRLAEAEETTRTRRAHLAYFTELTETAEPHLRRAEQLDWLAALRIEHDNINTAVRGAIEAGEAQEAMRLTAAAGWYWWLGGHKREGTDHALKAASLPGEVTDEVRATAYALVVLFVTSGQGDQYQAQEWIHEAYRFTERSKRQHPLLGFAAPMERMLREPTDFLPAFEPLLTDADPWVRAQGRLSRGRMRITLGQDTPEAEADIEAALAEFRALGERWGISFALDSLADRLAMRGEFAGACGHYEQAIAVVAEVGAIEDVVRMRTRQAQLYWLLGDERASASSMADAQAHADRIAWPDALAELALAQAELARWRGDVESARHHLARVHTMLGPGAEASYFRAVNHDLLGYLTDDPGQARRHRRAAFSAASDAGHLPLIARVLVGIADLALCADRPRQAARLLAASVNLLGLPDRSQPDIARIENAVRHRLGDAEFARASREGRSGEWRDLVEDTLGE